MSIFGSLGVVSATLITFIAFRDIKGAKIREPFSMIMVGAGKGKNTGRCIIETRMDELIKGYDRRCAPVCFQRRSIYLFISGCQQPEEKHDMGLPGFHHVHAHSTTHSTMIR
jgi:hypothetical protein